jgi:protein-disulfide isomerase
LIEAVRVNRRNVLYLVVGVAVAAGIAFVLAFRDPPARTESHAAGAGNPDGLLRAHSPIIGPSRARVTIVEFFDPACEGCRAFYPIVKELMSQHPSDVRLALRYVQFHKGSAGAIRLLEAAREQDLYVPVLEAILATQSQWHFDPSARRAWDAAAGVGLDIAKARDRASSPEVTAILESDAADAGTLGLRQTPTFYVNGRPLPSFGPEQLVALVREELDTRR